MSRDNGDLWQGAFCRTTLFLLYTENIGFWKLLRRNFVVSFRNLLDFLFGFFVVDFSSFWIKSIPSGNTLEWSKDI